MPRNVFLSFLGTNDYLPCTYFASDGFEKPDVRFVQEALVAWNCPKWDQTDRVFIFITDEAKKKNWLDDGQVDHKNQPQSRKGLLGCLQELGIQAQIKPVPIPDGKSEKEIWDIFQQVYSVLEPEDRVVLDITHALRSLPMLAIVLMNYAKTLKRITLTGIHYGAFETLGSIREVTQIPLEKRRVPIFDLTPFDTLMDWSTGVDRFLSAGDATVISQLAKKSVYPVLRESKGKNQDAKSIQTLANAIQDFTQALSTCRGRNISQNADNLKSAASACLKTEPFPPFQPIIHTIHEKISPFSDNEFWNGVCAAEWCLRHNMIQQGYTILLETLVSYAANLVDIEEDKPEILKLRELASSGMFIAQQGIPESDWKNAAQEHIHLTRKMITEYRKKPELINLYAGLLVYRNDLNHAGISQSPISAEKLIKQLQSFVDTAKKLIPSDS